MSLASISTAPRASATDVVGLRRTGLSWRSLRRMAMHAMPAPSATPLAIVLLVGLLASGLLLDVDRRDVPMVVTWASTNVHNLASHPIEAMIASAFVVPGLPLTQIAIVVIACAALERQLGTARTVFVALSGQVVATLLTEYGAELGAHLGLWVASSSERPDVGISYVMFSVAAASWLLVKGPMVGLGIAATSAYAGLMFVQSPDMTSTGHLVSIASGLGTMWLVRARLR